MSNSTGTGAIFLNYEFYFWICKCGFVYFYLSEAFTYIGVVVFFILQ